MVDGSRGEDRDCRMNIGVRAHDFGKLPLAVLAQKICDKGFTCIQLALAKAISDIDSSTVGLDAGIAHRIADELWRKNVRISVLGCYINPIHPDLVEREKQLDRFRMHLALARDFGCNIVATETGSINPDCSYHEKNNSEEAFNELVDSVSSLAEVAEKYGVFACIEGVTRHTISSPDLMAKALDSVKSPNLRVLFDPVNLISPDNYNSQADMIEKSFALFGDKIMVMHAKDFMVEKNMLTTTFAGNGMLNYEHLLGIVKKRNPDIDILIEDLAITEMDKARDFISGVYTDLIWRTV
jgi:L-ribulose-5-phosphate 3-epimerase